MPARLSSSVRTLRCMPVHPELAERECGLVDDDALELGVGPGGHPIASADLLDEPVPTAVALVLGEEVGDVVVEGVGPLSPPGAPVSGEHAASDRVSGTRRPDRVEHRHAEAVGVAAWCRPAAEWAQLVAACGDHKIDVRSRR